MLIVAPYRLREIHWRSGLLHDDLTTGPKATRQQQFEGVAWLIERFGDDCVHARAGHDEETYHIQSSCRAPSRRMGVRCCDPRCTR